MPPIPRQAVRSLAVALQTSSDWLSTASQSKQRHSHPSRFHLTSPAPPKSRLQAARITLRCCCLLRCVQLDECVFSLSRPSSRYSDHSSQRTQWSAGTFVGPKTCVQRSVQCARVQGCVLTTRFTMAAGHSQCEGRIRYGSSIAGPGAQSGNRTKDPVAPGTASGMDQCIELPSSSSPSGCGCRNSSHTRVRVAVVACLTLLLPDGGRMCRVLECSSRGVARAVCSFHSSSRSGVRRSSSRSVHGCDCHRCSCSGANVFLALFQLYVFACSTTGNSIPVCPLGPVVLHFPCDTM